jgi:beta-galactosidase
MRRQSSSTKRALVALLIVFSLLLPCGLLSAAPGTDASGPGSPQIPTQIAGHSSLSLGVAWYPEQWPESRWDEELRLMEAAHVTVVRLAEFAWSTMEPAEGRFELDWLERAVRLAETHHLDVVLGTPTAAPPAWLTSRYPETLRAEPDGRRVTHGGRAHGSVTSPVYRRYRMRITEQMASRFGHDPNVIGWQIDNEYCYALMSYDDDARRQFQDWLKAKYQSLDRLNRHWSTAYWSQTYDAWAEIPIPVGAHNPGLMLEWKRFVTQAWNDYQKNEIELIRRHADARQFTTGNFLGSGFDGFDHYVMSEPLTFASWSDYVPTGHLDPLLNGMAHDMIRGFKRQNFWVMETQPGNVNWSTLNNALDKGEVRAMAWHAIGRGADAVAYWQWRSAPNGQEQYHGTLVGPDGAPRPILEEVRQLGRELSLTQSVFRDTSVVSRVAILNDYESRWAIQWQRHNDAYDQLALLNRYYRALRRPAQSIDVVSPHAPLAGYALVVAPSLNVIPEALAAHLLDYVRGGGHLVLGPRAGMKDEYNALLPQRQPGFLVQPLGGRVEELYALEKGCTAAGAWGTGAVSLWAELLSTSRADVEILLRYGHANGWLDGQPAALTRKEGNGRITYVGAVLDDTLLAAAAEWMLRQSAVAPVFGPLPEGIDVSRRVGPGKQVFVLANFAGQSWHVSLPRAMRSLLDGKDADSLELAPYDVAVLLAAEPKEKQ